MGTYVLGKPIAILLDLRLIQEVRIHVWICKHSQLPMGVKVMDSKGKPMATTFLN